jgi:hypothetical protein
MEIDLMARLLSTIQEILVLCKDSPDAASLARQRLVQIAAEAEPMPVPSPSPEKSRVAQAIEDSTRALKTRHKAQRPTSVMFRDIAQVLANKNNLRYNPKTKRYADLMVWFDENWDAIGGQFQGLLTAELLAKK